MSYGIAQHSTIPVDFCDGGVYCILHRWKPYLYLYSNITGCGVYLIIIEGVCVSKTICGHST